MQNAAFFHVFAAAKLLWEKKVSRTYSVLKASTFISSLTFKDITLLTYVFLKKSQNHSSSQLVFCSPKGSVIRKVNILHMKSQM